jgi:hypothetical protein
MRADDVVKLSGGGMHQRRSAEFVIDKLLSEQRHAPIRSAWERFLGRSPLGKNCEGWYLAALGEIDVGSRLAALSNEWTVFHALPVGLEGWDIDHLIVGPGGVITINSKHHRGERVLVDGGIVTVGERTVPYLRHAEFEANHVTELMLGRRSLSAPVRPVLVFVGSRGFRIRTAPTFVTVVPVDGLLGWILSLPVVLDKSECRRLSELFDNTAMWANVEVDTGNDLMDWFRALHAEVRSARRQRHVLLPLYTLLGGGSIMAGGVALTGAIS